MPDEPNSNSNATTNANMFRTDPQTGQRLPEKPRRVRGGVRLADRSDSPEFGWLGTILLESFDGEFDAPGLEEGLAYARSGQTKSIAFERGSIAARVQGRRERAYAIAINLPTLRDEDTRKLTSALAERAIHGARILEGEVTPDTYQLFESLGISLVPTRDECTINCGCEHEAPMCKHVRCLLLVLAQTLDADPMKLFTLRGIDREELTEELRRLRTERVGAQTLAAPLPMNGLLPDELHSPSLQESIDDFWTCGPELDDLETPIRPPSVSHGILRRLGPSPFTDAKFPLVGLLATCYDVISERALSEPDEE